MELAEGFDPTTYGLPDRLIAYSSVPSTVYKHPHGTIYPVICVCLLHSNHHGFKVLRGANIRVF